MLRAVKTGKPARLLPQVSPDGRDTPWDPSVPSGKEFRLICQGEKRVPDTRAVPGVSFFPSTTRLLPAWGFPPEFLAFRSFP